MVDATTLRRLALALPGATDTSTSERWGFEVAGKGFAWSFMERTHPKKPRVARLDVLAVRCPIERKEFLIEAAPDRFFDDDHYRGYPAVLARLEAVDEAELDALLRDAYRMTAEQAAKPRRRRARTSPSRARSPSRCPGSGAPPRARPPAP